jgi:hypothetical protein
MSESDADVDQEPRSIAVESREGWVVLGAADEDENALILTPTEAETLGFELLRATTDALAHRAVVRYRDGLEAELEDLAAAEPEELHEPEDVLDELDEEAES